MRSWVSIIALDACDNPAINSPAARIDTTITLLIIAFSSF
jgi:hypothetical protein